MRHLRRFNEVHLSKEEIDEFKKEIMVIFQDVIDEFDLEELPDYLGELDECPGVFYTLHDFYLTNQTKSGKSYLEIELYVGDKFIDKFKSMETMVCNFCSHLKSMGYGVDTIPSILDLGFRDYISALVANDGGESYCSTVPFEIHIYYK